MRYDFDTPAGRAGNGNMKGGMGQGLPSGAILLAGAEMDYPTAPCIRQALADFAQNGLYGFTLPDAAYRQSIVDWARMARNWTISPEQIVPTAGTIFGLCTAVRAFTDPGDAVIIQHPSYYRFDRAIRRNGRTVVSNPMHEKDGVYAIDFEDLEVKIRANDIKLMVLCNPHNPTAKVFDRSVLQRVAALAEVYRFVVLSDEIFAETAQPGFEVVPYASVDPVWGITSTSLGKTFNLTGVNQANLVIPNEALRAAYRAQQDIDHFGSIDPFFYNALRAAYTAEGLAWVQAMNAHTLANYELLRAALAERMPRLTLSPLEGSFVTWLDCRRLGLSDAELAAFWEREALVLPDPGEEYGPGGSGFVRLNLATPKPWMEQTIENLDRAYHKRGF